jgi:DNA-binding transcriptional MerR regulator
MTERHLPAAPATLRAGEVADRAHVNVQTLRYYERRGLLPEPRRLRSGHRAYPVEAVRMVRFIKQAQALGFTLEEIKSLQRLTGDLPGNCEKAQDLAAARISELDQKISQLRQTRDALSVLTHACREPHPAETCPLTHSLASGDT